MKLLFIAGPTMSNVFALTPLALAARGRGHQVIMASPRSVAPAILGAGLPAFTMTPLSLEDLVSTDRAGNPTPMPADESDLHEFSGRMFGRLAAESLAGLSDLTANWRPDLIIGGPHAYAAPLLAAELGVPSVRHTLNNNATDRVGAPPCVEEPLQPELEKLGLDRVPDFGMCIDIFPPCVRPPGEEPMQPMQWTPVNSHQVPLEPWMFTRQRRRRVVVTAGSLTSSTHNFEFMRGLTKALAALDAELLVAAPTDAAELLRNEPGVDHAGWIPLDVVIPTCDLVVHHSVGLTALSALGAGVPQLTIPQEVHSFAGARRMAEGGAISLLPGEDTPDAVVDACHTLLTQPEHVERARSAAKENAAMPLPDEMVVRLEGMAAA